MSSSAEPSSAEPSSAEPPSAELPAEAPEERPPDADEWAAFEQRPVPGEPEPQPLAGPDREVAFLLQRYWDDMQAEQERARKETAQARTVLTELAVHVARLEGLLREAGEALRGAAGAKSLGRRLQVARKQVLEPLHAMGITTDDPAGRPYDEVADVVDITGWRYGPEFAAEVVAETVEPVVLDRGTVVRLGQVIMGAPPSAGTEDDA